MILSRMMVAASLLVSFAVTQNQTVVANESAVRRDASSVINNGDRLAIHIQNVLPGEAAEKTLQVSIELESREQVPAYSVQVNADGELRSPLINRLAVAGLTVEKAERMVSAIYEKEDILRKGSKICIAIEPHVPTEGGLDGK
ncbi:Polysaccharide biosynthesis/export protein [Rubripirellula amarantea]|uniref:Polysaccharide biosynthesis/export protein n=1 Tax=Rubripirellula amarantea TaxID=2527999 RepID=A0A5C5WWQ9_9BACT|nr:polysaccharide biosynthesis/export family protein [Rubripirellula amarantea]TWT55146.1 Polysaccharide biosynthesis/export protein [Rubripirellula amarantea]